MSSYPRPASGRAKDGSGFGEFFRYHGWLAPGVRLFRSISFPSKAACIAMAFVVPLLFMLFFIWTSARAQIEFASSERQGVTYARPLVDLIKLAQQRRRSVVTNAPELAELQDKVAAAFDKVKAKHDELGTAFNDTKEYEALAQAHQALMQSAVAAMPDETFKHHSNYITAIIDLIGQVANGSQLTLDPDLDTFHMMNMSVLRGPLQYENTAKLRGMGAMILKTNELTPQRRDLMSKWLAQLDMLEKDVESSYRRSIEFTPEVAQLFDMKGTNAAALAFSEAVRQQVMGQALSGDAATLLALGNAAVDQQIKLSLQVMDRLDSQLQARIDRLQSTLISQLAFTAFFVGLAGYLMLSFYKVMMGGLHEVSGHLQAITKGNLSTAPKPWGNDEAARLMITLGEMQNSLRRIVGVVLDGAANVQAASNEIASASLNLSQRTEQSAASLQQTTASMEQIKGSMKHSSDMVNVASGSAEANALAADHGGVAIAKVVHTMQGIRESSSKISEIISVIDGIAFQTNILALNAAVESARAGEHGRGFAVVASEVRALAGRSALAAKEIKSLIGSSMTQVETGSAVVAKAGESMRAVVDNAAKISKLMKEIAEDTRHQNQGVGEVTAAVRILDDSTQQNAALVEETAAASGSLADQAQRLSNEVSFFKLI